MTKYFHTHTLLGFAIVVFYLAGVNMVVLVVVLLVVVFVVVVLLQILLLLLLLLFIVLLLVVVLVVVVVVVVIVVVVAASACASSSSSSFVGLYCLCNLCCDYLNSCCWVVDLVLFLLYEYCLYPTAGTAVSLAPNASPQLPLPSLCSQRKEDSICLRQ